MLKVNKPAILETPHIVVNVVTEKKDSRGVSILLETDCHLVLVGSGMKAFVSTEISASLLTSKYAISKIVVTNLKHVYSITSAKATFLF